MTKSNVQDGRLAPRVLILGGTKLARLLAGGLAGTGAGVVTSLAGRTRDPIEPEGALRIGGFGGADGLARYLTDHRIDWLVDATHPFAARISANAASAARATGTPILRLEPSPWARPEGANWIEVPDMAAAAGALPSGANVLLTIGRQQIAAFSRRTDCRFVARMIEPPDSVPPGWEIVLARGPFTLADEAALIERSAFTHLVSKNAGGPFAAKLVAASERGLPVVMVDRPPVPPVQTCTSVAGMLERLGLP